MYSQAFAADPQLVTDAGAQSGDVYNAACSAALAGTDRAADSYLLDDAALAKQRAQALEWMKVSLGAWTQVAQGGGREAAPAVAQSVGWWKDDPDMAGVRGDAIARLPETERAAWRALWKDVDALLAKAH
jgi:hypothetical protein